MLKKILPLVFIILIVHSHDTPHKMVNTTLSINKGSYRMTLRQGKHADKHWNRAIDQEGQFIWIYDKLLNETLPENATLIGLVDQRTVYEADYSFINSEIKLNALPIHVDPRGMTKLRTGSFGFGRTFKNQNYSLVHRLQKAGYIDHLAYSFLPNGTNNGHIVFGGIPDEIRHSTKGGLCKVDKLSNGWSCKIQKVTFGYVSYTNNHTMHFQVLDDPIYVPKDFMDILMNRFFNERLASQGCAIVNMLKKTMIKCKLEEINTFPPLNFTIDDFQYTLYPHDIFDIEDKYGYLNIALNPYSNTSWYLGISFMKHFNALFDYERDVVELFSNTRVENVKVERFMFFLLNCGVLTLGICMIILCRCYCDDDEEKNKNKNKA